MTAPVAEDGDLEADAALIDRLYGDADEADDSLRSLRMVRGLIARVRDEAPELEPPQAVSARLLLAADEHAPKRAAAVAVETEKPGLVARFVRWFAYLSAHPGMAAAGTLVIVAGAAAIWMQRGGQVAERKAPAHESRSAESSAGTQAESRDIRLDEAPAAPEMKAAGAGSGSSEPTRLDVVATADPDPAPARTGLPTLDTPHADTRTAPHTPQPKGKAGPAKGIGGGKQQGLEQEPVEGSGGPGEGTVTEVGASGDAAGVGGDDDAVDGEEDRDGTKREATGRGGGGTTSVTVTGSYGDADEGTADKDTLEKPRRTAPKGGETGSPPPPPTTKKTDDAESPTTDTAVQVTGAERQEVSNAELARQLTRQATTAAKKNNCQVVDMLAKRVSKLDKGYYKATFVKQPDIAKCRAKK